MSQTRMSLLRRTDDVELCVETIGDAADPAVLLIGGATWSMDWWDPEFCALLASRGRRVVRYDQRDTGQSTSYPVGSPGYTGEDLVADAVAILDGLGIERAHVVGLSMGGGVAQRMALGHRDRVATLTLIATSPIDGSPSDLPGPTSELHAVFSSPPPEPDWNSREAVVDYIVSGERPFAGTGGFAEARLRMIAERVFDRTVNIAAAMTNHFLLDSGDTADLSLTRLGGVPTLILHGRDDPLFPIQHGRALAELIPGARLVELDGMGHESPPHPLWELVVSSVIDHTGAK